MTTGPTSEDPHRDAPVLVTGGTGTLGGAVVDRLLELGHPVRLLSRRPAPDAPGTAEWMTGDLTTGAGVDAATENTRAVIHCATMRDDKDVRATRVLAESAQRTRGASPHLVYISIVGVDRVPFSYYRAKLAAEHVLHHSPLPWTVLRTTQFHDLVTRMTTAQRRLPVTFALRGTCFQPVDKTEVAARLVELALGEPVGRAEDMGGPEVLPAPGLARSVQRAYGIRGPVVPVSLPGKLFRAYRNGCHLAPDRAHGRITFEEYLRSATAGRGSRRQR